jgi:hypothetical protein
MGESLEVCAMTSFDMAAGSNEDALSSTNTINSPKVFCEKLLAQLVIRRRRSIPLGDPIVERGFSKVLEHLIRVAEEESGSDRPPRDEIEAVIVGLSPDPNSGTFDQFWSTLRRLQPGMLSVPNPNYPELAIGLSKVEAEKEMDGVSEAWRQVIKGSAEFLAVTL